MPIASATYNCYYAFVRETFLGLLSLFCNRNSHFLLISGDASDAFSFFLPGFAMIFMTNKSDEGEYL